MCASDRECKIDGTGTSMTGARVVLSLVHSDAKVYLMSYRANQRCSDLSAAKSEKRYTGLSPSNGT